MMWWWSWWTGWFSVPVAVRRARGEDAPAIAALHAAAFAHPWSLITIESMLADRAIHAHVAERNGAVAGFILSRLAADEAEILSVSMAAALRGNGHGRTLVKVHCDDLVRARARQVFLEVEAGNMPAIRLYRRLGFVDIGRRTGYYALPDGTRRDALTMRLDLAGHVPVVPVVDG